MRETDPRFINLRKKVGLFFVFALAGIIATLAFIGIERDILTPKYHVYFTADKGTGFYEGMPVKLSGFKIGKIKSLYLDENARVRVGLLINKKYQKWIRKDSRAMLAREGLIGESVVDITAGAPDTAVLKENSEIQYEKTKGLENIAEEIKPVIAEVRNIIRYINDPEGDIRQALSNLRTLSSGLHTTKENLDRLLNNTDTNISNVSSKTIQSIQNVDALVENVNKTISDMDRKIMPVMDKLDRTMDNAEKATAGLKDAVEKTAPKIPVLLNKGEDIFDDAGDVITSLKQTWPIRIFIEKPKDAILHGDSYE
ncbi:MAG: MCE family protein [Nitrospirae bacterium]|nr:MCE family protein [Nitrospirota bacterium]